MISGDNNLSIRVSLGENNPSIIYSKQIDRKQDTAIRSKIIQISDQISSDLKKNGIDGIKQFNFIFKPSGELRVVVRLQNKDVEYTLEFLESKAKKESQLLVGFLNRAKIFSLKNAPKTHSHYSFVNTHYQFSKPEINKEGSHSLLEKVVTFFQRFFAFHISMRPLANNLIHGAIKNQTPEELKNLYANQKELFTSIKKEILTKDPAIKDLYTDQELEVFINEQFIQEVNTKLKKEKLPSWDQKTLYQLDLLRVVNHIKANGLTTKGYEILLQASPLDIPLDALAGIPITPANEDALAEIWKHAIGNLFAKGALGNLASKSDLSGVIVQTEYAANYLKALETVPNEIKRDLSPFLADLYKKQPLGHLRDFLIQHSTSAGAGIDLKDPKLALEQKIYNKKVKEPIQKFIQEKTKESKDVKPLAKLLGIQGGSHNAARELIEGIEAKLTTEEKEIFDKQKLYTFLYNQLERAAVLDYNLTTPQLENLRQYREDFRVSQKHTTIIQDAIVNHEEKVQDLKKTFKKLINEEKLKLADPKVKLPAMELPLELASEEDKKAAINEQLKNLRSSEIEVRKGIKTLESEIKSLKKKALKGGAAARNAQKDIKTKTEEIETSEKRLKLIENLKEAQSKGDQEKLQSLLSGMKSIPVGPRTVDVNELPSIYLTALKDRLQKLEAEVVELTEKASSKKSKSIKQDKIALADVKKQIAGIQELFARIDMLKKQQEGLGQLDKEKESKLAELRKEFSNQYEQLLDEHVSIDAIINSGTGQFREFIDEAMWEQALTRLMNNSQLDKIDSGASLDEAMKKQLRPYIRAKAMLGEMKVSGEARDKLNAIVSRLEGKIANEEVKTYLTEAPKAYVHADLDEMLLGNDALNEIKKSDSTSVLSADQQVDLMRLTKLLNKASKPTAVKKPKGAEEGEPPQSKLTVEEKKELADVLERAQQDEGLREALNSFIAEEGDRDDIDKLLSYVPSFLRGVVRKFVAPDKAKKEDKIPGGITERSVNFMRTYLSKTRSISKSEAEVTKLHNKMESLLAKYQENPASIKPEDRLTLTEIGKISRSARLNESDDEDEPSFLGQLRDLGLMEVNPGLQKLSDKSVHSQELLANLDKIVRPEINAHYQNGDLLAYVGKKKGEWLNSPISIEERLTSFAASGFTHGAKLFRNGDEVQVSHVYGDFEQEKLSLYQLCISDIWEIDITPLVPSSLQATLKKVYGEEWPQKVNEIYREVENELQTRAVLQFEKVGNDQDRRIAAGFADHPTLFKLAGRDVKGHEREHDRDFNKLHAKFFGYTHPTDDQICSEWASKATLAAMLETNKRLAADIRKSGNTHDGKQVLQSLGQKGVQVPQDVSDYLNGVRHWKAGREKTKQAEKKLVAILKQQGYSSEDIQLIIKLGNEEIFDLPYSRKERLKAIHPGRMVSLLVDKKCAKQKQPPQALASLIAVH